MQINAVGAPAGAAVPEPPAARPEAAVRFEAVLRELDKGEIFVERVIRQAGAGRDFSPEELIAVQAGVYRHTQSVEAFGKIVDAVTGSIRRTIEAAG